MISHVPVEGPGQLQRQIGAEVGRQQALDGPIAHQHRARVRLVIGGWGQPHDGQRRAPRPHDHHRVLERLGMDQHAELEILARDLAHAPSQQLREARRRGTQQPEPPLRLLHQPEERDVTRAPLLLQPDAPQERAAALARLHDAFVLENPEQRQRGGG
jgi:hypothetical protein